MSHFVQYIWNYNNVVNYNIAYSKVASKYLLTVFYNKTNKKKYDSQIRHYNIQHTNIIAIKDMIILVEKNRDNEELLVIENVNKTAIAEVVKVLSIINLDNKHGLAISNDDMDATEYLRLIGIEKY